MNLVLKIKGEVQENNILDFKEAMLAKLADIPEKLITDDDFAKAKESVKVCKEVKKSIKLAKETAVAGMKSVNDIFTALDEIHASYHEKEKSLDSQIKKDQQALKTSIVQAGVKELTEFYESLDVLQGHFKVDVKEIQNALTRKSAKASMEKSVAEVVEARRTEAQAICENYKQNMASLNSHESAFPGLFPDKKNLSFKAAGEVEAIATSRINEFKLKQKEAEERAKKEREEQERIRQEEERLKEQQKNEIPAKIPEKKEVEVPDTKEPISGSVLPPLPKEPPLPCQEPPAPEPISYPRQTIVTEIEGAPEDLYHIINTLENLPGVVSVRVAELEAA